MMCKGLIHTAALLAALGMGTGCTGDIGGGKAGNGDDGPGSPGGKFGGGAGRGGTSGAGGAGGETVLDARDFDTSPGLRRLTRVEYVNTVADLLGVTVEHNDPPREFVVQGHSEIAGAQKVGYDDNNAFLGLGEKVAETATPKLAAEVTACADATCLKTWAGKFLTRAFRGPAPTTVLDRYAAILSSTDAGSTPTERLTSFLIAVLTSPHFLYRKELGTAAGSDSTLRTLNAYEIASRLSYLVWQSAPDAELLDAATKGTLTQPAQRLTQLDRMLKDAKAQRGLRNFVADWMGLFDDNLAKKNPEVLAGTGTDFPKVAQQGFDLLVDDVLAAKADAHFPDLLKADYAFANDTLGKVMGAQGGTATFAKVSLDTNARRGILTHPMVIGAHSKEGGASPFPIGKFIFENVLCDTIPPPPQSFPTVADSSTDGLTLRQKLEAMTKNQPCASCHQRIGPPGFAFLPFDPVGRYKNQDAKGQPYDVSGNLLLGDKSTPFNGISDLAMKLSGEPAVQSCVARRLFRWAFGRYESDKDRDALAMLDKAATTSSAAVGELMRQMVAAPTFGQVRVRAAGGTQP